MDGSHCGRSSSAMIFSRCRNSVGAPKLTPIICPAQPPAILSRSSASGISLVSSPASEVQETNEAASKIATKMRAMEMFMAVFPLGALIDFRVTPEP